MKKVVVASPRGFCAGVERAVEAVDLALQRYGSPLYVRKQIVHNEHVVRGFQERGVVFVDSLTEVPAGSVVVFSAHGVAPSVREEASQRGLTVVDATCPLVSKVHAEAQRFSRDGHHIILVGHAGHEEVEGTMGHALGNVTLVQTPQEADDVQIDSVSPVVWLSQTTLSVDETSETVERLRQRVPALMDPPSDDICYATQNRQNAVKAIAQQVDLMLIVGSANSSNTVRLVDVARGLGVPAYRIEDFSELDATWFRDDSVQTVGLSSGASVPEHLVDDVLSHLASYGYDTVEHCTTTQENVVFSPPKAVRGANGES